MKILAIETSCDETAISLIEASGELPAGPKFEVLENLISSQIELHRPYGGVVPNIAKREHIKNLPILYRKIFSNFKFQNPNIKQIPKSKYQIEDIDLIAVTVGPGLAPALWAGINFAQELAEKYDIPIIGTNHLEGHIYSFLLASQKETVNFKSQNPNIKQINKDSKSQIPNPKNPDTKYEIQDTDIKFPAIALLVSGGHTILIKMDSLTKWKKIGETKDDAVGEAFDKVARILDLPYPGGPEIEELAKKGNPRAIEFPRPMIHQKNYDFSFSGLKTSVLYYVRDNLDTDTTGLDTDGTGQYADIAASFQKAAIDVLTKKTFRAVEEFGANSLILAGGVAANKMLRERLQKESDEEYINFLCPEFEFNTDNASMIGAAAYIHYLTSKKKTGKVIGKYKLEANSNLNL